jgi:hypothetical protein
MAFTSAGQECGAENDAFAHLGDGVEVSSARALTQTLLRNQLGCR